MKNNQLKRVVLSIWLVNIFSLLFLAGLWLINSAEPLMAILLSPTPTPSTIPSLTPSKTATNTITASQTLTPPPSITPSPTSAPTRTITPIPFYEGPLVIGSSVENRPLEVYRFGTGVIERLVVSGMHGGSEYNTIQLADELIIYITEHPEIVPDNVTLFILRSLNPDGEVRARNFLGRANAHNVDLNRNWDANWQKEWPRENCWTFTYVTAGSAPGSEPETQALMSFIQNHQISAIINYHSAALGIFPGGLPPEESTIHFAESVAAVTSYPYPPVNIGCLYTGGFTDWADERGIPALDVELTDHTNTDFDMNLLVLKILLNWMP